MRKFVVFTIFIINLFLSIEVFADPFSRKSDVIIIGAGISGLAAAQELKLQGYHVLILEAKNRIGGRILTNSKWGNSSELGGSWLHSSKTNPLVPILKKENISLEPTQYQLTAPLNKFNSMIIYKNDNHSLSQKDK